MPRAGLDPDERATLEKLLAVVLPSTTGAGATEAGAVDYVMQRLAGPEHEWLPGLLELVRTAAGREEAEVARLCADGDPWFGRLRAWAWEGFLCDPALGGNRDGVGWQRFGATARRKATHP